METAKFGKYHLIEQIAVGKVAQVWKAQITGIKGMEQYLVIKRLLPHLSTKKGVVDIFLGEAKRVVGLRHESIVRIYDYGAIEGTPYVAQEYVEGKDLGAFMAAIRQRGRALGLDQAVYIIEKIAEALDFAHKQDLIHGGLSPQNVLVSRRGEVKVSDFSISRAALEGMGDDPETLEKSAPYLSPEFVTQGLINVKTDIFCAGVLFCELLTGQPWLGGDPKRALSALKDQGFDPASQVPEDLPQGLRDILRRALARDPAKRYLSPTIMFEEIKRVVKNLAAKPSGEEVADLIVELFPKVEAAKKADQQEEVEEGQEAPEQRPEAASVPKPDSRAAATKKLLFGGIAALLVLGLAAFFLFSRGDEEEGFATPGAPGITASKGSVDSPAPPTQGKASVERPQAPDTVQEGAPKKEAPPDTPEKQPPPDPGRLELQKGVEALAQGQYDKAISIFKAVASKYPELKEDLSIPYSQALEAKAKTILDKQPKRATALLKEAVSLNPENVEAHFHLGLLHGDQKKFSMAIDEYKRVVQLDPQYADAYFNLGYIYAVRRDYENAEKAYKEVVNLAPPYLDEALFNLAMVQKRLGKREACIQNLKRAIIVNPDNKLAKKYLKKMTGK